ncbi:MAG: carboxypeptidase-like regulatory domain-containing protein [Bacteroidales bacterium]|nr:carboxypeptidase-like regulatory domain-containing protein [Bacteroidales bacterium]
MKSYLYIICRVGLITIVMFALLSLFSCRENESNQISGVVTDMSTGEPVGNAKVKFEITEIMQGSYNSAFSFFKETYTDSEGKFLIEFESRNFVKMRLEFSKDDYHSIYSTFEPEGVSSDYVVNGVIPKKSFISVKVHNAYPNNPDDVVKIRLQNINPECNVCCNSDYRFFYGAFVDTSFVCKVVGGDYITVNYISIHQEQSNVVESQVYCTPGDTVMFNCYY